MRAPQAVRKHDARVVAFDLERLAVSIARAARASGERPDTRAAAGLGAELARAVAEFLVEEYTPIPCTADVRELTARLLRETAHLKTAEVYGEHARSTAALLWRLRVVDTGCAEGTPWDRRRLMDSLRAAGVARDPAGEVSRQTERHLVALGEERVSAALIHALAALALTRRGLDARGYLARRVAVNLAGQTPRYNAEAARACPLPPDGPAAEAFWLQALHSPEVAAAARANQIALEPFPHRPDEVDAGPAEDGFLDPLLPDAPEALAEWAARAEPRCRVRADGPARAQALAAWLAGLGQVARGQAWPGEVILAFGPALERGAPSPLPPAPAITLNVAGLLVREALRELPRATPRLARLVTLAAQAHREREEYWGRSAVRGRELPLAVAGLWNAAAWLEGQPFERPRPGMPLRLHVGAIIAVLHGAVRTVREETGMDVALVSDGPAAASGALWRRDREHFARDGLNLDPAGGYALGLEMRLGAGLEELGPRLDFLRAVAPLFDHPPALGLEAPLGQERGAAAWRELLEALAQTGVPRARLTPGGSSRAMRLLARLTRAHLEGYPLFEHFV